MDFTVKFQLQNLVNGTLAYNKENTISVIAMDVTPLQASVALMWC